MHRVEVLHSGLSDTYGAGADWRLHFEFVTKL
uniref:Uncharacterized protein n=1 Tax=Anguilla anguilla TaxID=7936 RepID=A0A0E9RRV1_ANGAN